MLISSMALWKEALSRKPARVVFASSQTLASVSRGCPDFSKKTTASLPVTRPSPSASAIANQRSYRVDADPGDMAPACCCWAELRPGVAHAG
jgi:hypothetical protein